MFGNKKSIRIFDLSKGTNIHSKLKKHDIMNNLKLTIEQYLKALNIGDFELIESVSDIEKIVIHYKVCGRTEKILIKIIPTK
jgi:hypothetical protein